MPALLFVGFIGYVILSLTFCSKQSEPEPQAVSDSDAEGVAMHLLALGKVTGCGSFEITSRDKLAKRLEVKCSDGRTHVLLNKPMPEVNGKVVGL